MHLTYYKIFYYHKPYSKITKLGEPITGILYPGFCQGQIEVLNHLIIYSQLLQLFQRNLNILSPQIPFGYNYQINHHIILKCKTFILNSAKGLTRNIENLNENQRKAVKSWFLIEKLCPSVN